MLEKIETTDSLPNHRASCHCGQCYLSLICLMKSLTLDAVIIRCLLPTLYLFEGAIL
jgi:hypothetical protein